MTQYQNSIHPHLKKHLTGKHLIHNIVFSILLLGSMFSAQQFSNMMGWSSSASNQAQAIKLLPATNSVEGVCYIEGTDMSNPANHRACKTGEPVCQTFAHTVIGCESHRIIK